MVFELRWFSRGPNTRGPVLVVEPGVAIMPTEANTEARRGSGMSPRLIKKPTTAVDLSIEHRSKQTRVRNHDPE
jgi:hypothetical protein